MTNEDDMNFENTNEEVLEDSTNSNAPRARNKTVMLSPDVTGEVRARLAEDLRLKAEEGVPQIPSSTGGEIATAGSGVFLNGNSEKTTQPSLKSSFGVGQGANANAFSQPSKPVIPTAPAQDAQQGFAEDVDRVVYNKIGKVVAFLVSYDKDEKGDVFELRTGRMIITSEMGGTGNYLYIKDESVSQMHAILRITEDSPVQVLDQLSEHGTVVIRHADSETIELSGDKSELYHGDVLKFGDRAFTVCIIPE